MPMRLPGSKNILSSDPKDLPKRCFLDGKRPWMIKMFAACGEQPYWNVFVTWQDTHVSRLTRCWTAIIHLLRLLKRVKRELIYSSIRRMRGKRFRLVMGIHQIRFSFSIIHTGRWKLPCWRRTLASFPICIRPLGQAAPSQLLALKVTQGRVVTTVGN